MKPVRAAALILGLLLIVCVLSWAQTAEVSTWTIPTIGSLPEGVAIAGDGTVYFTEYSGGKIGRLDPTTNQIQEREVNGNPLSLIVEGTKSVYYSLPNTGGIAILVFDGGENRWNLPSGSVGKLARAASGPGAVNLWFNERTYGKIGRFAPTQIAVTMPFIEVPKTTVQPDVKHVDPVVTPVSPQRFPGNPALPPPIAAVSGMTNGPFTEWQAMPSGAYIEDIAVAPDGGVWFTQATSQIVKLDPGSNTMLFYDLPTGTSAVRITVNPAGVVWFTDLSQPAIGRLDPVTGNVTLWPIPGGVQPLELRYVDGYIWFVDREADAIGKLSRDENEISMYRLAYDTRPVDLEVADDGAVWFVCERGNIVGRLRIVSGPAAPPSVAGSCNFLSYAIVKVGGKKAKVTVTYDYDGSSGFPVFMGAAPLVDGVTVSDFDHPSAVVTEPGQGTVSVDIEYMGQTRLETSELWISMYTSDSNFICQKTVQFTTTWAP